MTKQAKSLLRQLKIAQSQTEFHAAEVLAYAYQVQLKQKRNEAHIATKQFVEKELRLKEQA